MTSLLRHTLAALAYRAHAPSRTPAEIPAHMGDLFDWALSIANGNQTWHDSAPLPVSMERLFQDPIADALTHVGQIAMLRRMAGCPSRAENYYVADIAIGRVGLKQPAPRREF
jgi:hypothetical protein